MLAQVLASTYQKLTLKVKKTKEKYPRIYYTYMYRQVHTSCISKCIPEYSDVLRRSGLNYLNAHLRYQGAIANAIGIGCKKR